MNYRDPELIEQLAAEYVLGTLQGQARQRFEALRREREDIDREASFWEESLSAWALRIQAVKPPARVWKAIQRRIGTGRTPGAERPATSRPWLALAASILLVGLIGVFMLRPSEIPPEPAAERLAVIQDEENTPLWRVALVGDSLDVRHIGAEEAGADRDYELWLLTEEGPISLGLLPDSGERRLPLAEELRQRVREGDSIAVSIEPQGGSPKPVPTGPVIAVAPLVAA